MSTVLPAQWHLYVVQVTPDPVQVNCMHLLSVQLAQVYLFYRYSPALGVWV